MKLPVIIEVIAVIAMAVLLGKAVAQRREANENRHEIESLRDQLGDYASESANLRRDLSYHQRLSRVSTIDSGLFLEGEDSGGNVRRLAIPEKRIPLLLYSIDVRCPTCFENLPFVSDLLESSPCPIRIEGILLNGLDSLFMVPSESLKFPVLAGVHGNAWEILPLSVPSSTVVMGSGGQGVRWWAGKLSPQDQASIIKFVGLLCEAQGGTP
jgi:hypothetical protein